MKGLIADVNIQGQVDALVVRMQAEPWKVFWDHLALKYVHFHDVGLALDAADAVVWETCQKVELVLVTDNRTMKGTDSLQATIQARNTPTSLPVFTIANVRHLGASNDYAQKVLDKLIDALLRIDGLRGIGRLYLP